jgi:hypothetical protein
MKLIERPPVGKRTSVCRVLTATGVTLIAASALRAEHARIDLSVSCEGKQVTATADQEPPAGGFHEPPVLKVKANQPLVFQFFLTDTYPHGVIEHVRVRYYVARAGKLGRKPSSLRDWSGPDDKSEPPLHEGVVTEGQFFMDFKPDRRVGARVKLKIGKPGIYSARVETLDTQRDHEHFSAIDIVVE